MLEASCESLQTAIEFICTSKHERAFYILYVPCIPEAGFSGHIIIAHYAMHIPAAGKAVRVCPDVFLPPKLRLVHETI